MHYIPLKNQIDLYKNAELSIEHAVYKDNYHDLLIQRDHMFGKLNMVSAVNHINTPIGEILKRKKN